MAGPAEALWGRPDSNRIVPRPVDLQSTRVTLPSTSPNYVCCYNSVGEVRFELTVRQGYGLLDRLRSPLSHYYVVLQAGGGS